MASSQVRTKLGLGIGLGLGVPVTLFVVWIFLLYRCKHGYPQAGRPSAQSRPIGQYTRASNRLDLELGYEAGYAHQVAHQPVDTLQYGGYDTSISTQAYGSEILGKLELTESHPSEMGPMTISLWDLEIKKSSTRSETFTPRDRAQPPKLHGPELMIQAMDTSADEILPAPFGFGAGQQSGGPSPGADSVVASNEPESGGSFICAVCERSFAKRHQLNRHTRLQHDRPHKCHVPGCRYATEGFGKHNDLVRHMSTVHSSLTPGSLQEFHLCPVTGCKYNTTGFGRKDHLKRHVAQQHNTN